MQTQQLLNRQKFVNASEIASILSIYLPEKYAHLYLYEQWDGKLTPYDTKYSLLAQKILTEEQIDLYKLLTTTQAMKKGSRLEEGFIEDFCKIENFKLLEMQPRFEKENLGASLDAIIEDIVFNVKYALEVKSSGENVKEDDTKIQRYKLQVQLQLYCADLYSGFLFVSCNSGNKYTFTIEKNEEIINDIKQASDFFFADLELFKKDNNYINADLTIKKDAILYGILNDCSVAITTVEEALLVYHTTKNIAKKFEEAKEFLQNTLTSEPVAFAGQKYYLQTSQTSYYTQADITKKQQDLTKQMQSLKVGDVKSSGRRTIKIEKV